MQKEHPRLVSLVPSWTETLFTFGFDTEVVGVTRWCVHPRELTERVEKVGGTKDPDVARIVALRPDLVVCEREENRASDVEALQAAGLDVWVSRVESVDDALREALRLGAVLGKEDAAASLAARMEAAMAEAAAMRPADAVPVYVPIWRRPWMGIGRETYAHHLLALAGARNVCAELTGRYPEAAPAQGRALGARAALLPDEPYPFEEKHVGEVVEAGFRPEDVRLLDGQALTWYGARTPEGLRTVAALVRSVGSGM